MKKRILVVFTLMVCTMCSVMSCSLLIKEEVLYEVDSSSDPKPRANITYTDAGGSDVSLTNEYLPWSETISIRYGEENALDSVTLTASTSDTGTTDVTATITWTK